MLRFGAWQLVDGVPAFADAAPVVEQHWSVVGNRAISLWHANDGTVALWDESDALRWLTAPDPEGTGISRLRVDGGPARVPVGVRTFGPTWFRVTATDDGIRCERTVLCPEGDVPWVLVRVELTSDDGRPHEVQHDELWRVRPRHALMGTDAERRRALAEAVVSFETSAVGGSVRADEQRSGAAPDVLDRSQLALIGQAFGGSAFEETDLLDLMGQPRTLVLESLGEVVGVAGSDGEGHPLLTVRTELTVIPDRPTVLWARFGRDELAPSSAPETVYLDSLSGLAARLPHGTAAVPEAREIPWHAALLTGAAARDEVVGGHTLNQGSAYSFLLGVDGATRDPLQHALPLVYSEPDLALSVLRHCVARATAEGDLPYALDAGKRPMTKLFQPSDQNLYALWLASEYLAATGDVAAFAAPLAYHPAHQAEPVSLAEHLCRQFRYFVDEVGVGERGHVRMRNADWNDGAIGASGVPREVMVDKGESVLNSAFAAWVLPVWAGAADRLGLAHVASEARAHADGLRAAVRESWNGRWYHRAYAPGADPVGEDECWLEPQPWAILCGAADPGTAEQLLSTIERLGRRDSPLGARVRFSAKGSEVSEIWYAINATLVWAAARTGADWAWDEWQRMSLARHSATYPDVWEGVLSGPDAWLGPESDRPGRTWAAPEAGISMQAFPVANAHAHAQPLFAYLRLLGVEPAEDGALRVGGGASFQSQTFALDSDGHGRLASLGEVVIQSHHGTASGTGTVTW
jgi:hypothetical protein